MLSDLQKADFFEPELLEGVMERTMDQLPMTVVLIEALGSVQAVDRLGFFGPNELLRDMAYQGTPTNRGGECGEMEGLANYERMVDAIAADAGPDVFDRAREWVEQLIEEVEQAEAESGAEVESEAESGGEARAAAELTADVDAEAEARSVDDSNKR